MTCVIWSDDVLPFFSQSSLKMCYTDQGIGLYKKDTWILTCISNSINYYKCKSALQISDL